MHLEKHQFLDYLAVKNSTLDCAYCGNPEWHMLIHEVDDIKNQRLMPFSINHLATKNKSAIALDVVVLVCSNCGQVRMHSMGKVLGDFVQHQSAHDVGA